MSRKSWHGQIRMSEKEPPPLLHFRTAYGSRETLIQSQSQVGQRLNQCFPRERSFHPQLVDEPPYGKP